MTFEHNPSPAPAERPVTSPIEPASAERSTDRSVPPQLRLQILSTEHWSLLATRSLAWNEVFARAGMFLSALAGAIVALALVGQGTNFGESFTVFAIVILPVVLFLGITTFVRLGASLYHDAQCVIGMNRIRAAYLELAPDLERYFVMSAHDDARGIGITMGFPPGRIAIVHLFSSTPTVVAIINSVIVGALLALIGTEFRFVPVALLVLAIAGFTVSFLIYAAYGRRAIARGQAIARPLFPTPSDE